MSDHFESGDITPRPEMFLPVGELTIPASFNEPIVPGISLNPNAREAQLPETGLVFVGMNSAAYTNVPKGRSAQIYTLGLAGCTGVAAAAQIDGGTLAGISHFDSMVDLRQREYGRGPTERFMDRFIDVARKCGAETIRLSVKYAELHRLDQNYGKFGDNYDDWHFVDQLESFAEEAEDDVQIDIEPYTDPFLSHTLAVNVDRNAQSEILFQ